MTIAVLLLEGGRASAQLTPAQKQEMKQHYDKATRAYDVQKYNEAVEEYQKAYEIGGDPAMLYNVAQSYRLAGQIGDALRFYRRYLQRSPNARNREDVERKIADLEKTLEERRKAAAASAPPVPVVPPPVVAKPPPSSMIQEEGGGSGRIAGIVVTSVGAAGLITSAIAGYLAGKKADELEQASMPPGTHPWGDTEENKQSNGKTLNTVAIVSAIAGGAAVITGVLLIVLSDGSHAAETAANHPFVSPMLAGDFRGAVATIRF